MEANDSWRSRSSQTGAGRPPFRAARDDDLESVGPSASVVAYNVMQREQKQRALQAAPSTRSSSGPTHSSDRFSYGMSGAAPVQGPPGPARRLAPGGRGLGTTMPSWMAGGATNSTAPMGSSGRGSGSSGQYQQREQGRGAGSCVETASTTSLGFRTQGQRPSGAAGPNRFFGPSRDPGPLSGGGAASSGCGGVQYLAVDVLNVMDIFCGQPSRCPPWVALKAMRQRAKEFVQTMKQEGFEVVAVLGGDTRDDASTDRWRARREQDLAGERKGKPLSVDIMLNECLRQAGATVCRPVGCLPKDMLAAFAHRGAGVLTRDRHFLLYDPPLTVFNGYRTERDGSLQLSVTEDWRYERARKNGTIPLTPRLVEEGLASCTARDHYDNMVAKFVPGMGLSVDTPAGELVRRGATSSSDKRLGSLHVKVAPLRAAVYARRGVSRVLEEVPVWRGDLWDGQVVWEERLTVPDSALDELLDDPLAAAQWLASQDGSCKDHWRDDPEEAAWREEERHFNRCVMATEACVVASERVQCLVDLLGEFPESLQARPARHHTAMPSEFPLPDPEGEHAAHVLNCVGCGAAFCVSLREARFLEAKGYDLPKRCQECRKLKAIGQHRQGGGRW